MQNSKPAATKPWWQFGHVWLVISGPAIVVIAAFVTLYLAVSSPNEMVSDQSYQLHVEQRKAQGAQSLESGLSPAMQARNHAATGEVPVSK
jgi:hypothetical protein